MGGQEKFLIFLTQVRWFVFIIFAMKYILSHIQSSMKNIFIYSLIIFFVTACKEERKQGADVGKVSGPALNQSANIDAFYPMLNQSDLSTNEIITYRQSATPIVNHRNKESGNKATAILTQDKWAYDGIFKGSEFITLDSTQVKWIDFKDDLTYEYGQNKEVKGSGIYAYNFDTGVLLMVDNEITMKPYEYKVKAHNDLIILEGMSTYQDNNIQAKLVRITDNKIK